MLLSGVNMTLSTALHTCDVSFHATLIGTFSKWPLIRRQKKISRKFDFAQCIVYLLILGFFNLRGINGDKKKEGKFVVSYTVKYQ